MAEFDKFSSVSGVLAKGYLNRTDLNKYDLALEEANNWFIDYLGGLSTRPGFEFHDFIEDDDKNIKFIPFQFGVNIANTYLIVISPGKVRFIQDGAYVLETAKNIVSVAAGVVTITGHGWSNGNWCKIDGTGTAYDGRTVVIADATTDTFTLTDPYGVVVPMTGWTSGGTISRIYTLTATVLNNNRIPKINYHQVQDTIRITSTEADFKPYNLTRIDSTNWTLTRVSFANTVEVPTNLAGDGSPVSSLPGSELIYVVTAVDENGQESLPSERLLISGIKDFTYTAGHARLWWDPVDNIRYYNVYRSILANDDKLTAAQQLGFVGRAYGPTFTDYNIVPDWTVSPPIGLNPFADNRIKFINVVTPGSGYGVMETVTVTDPDGSGFQGYPVVNDSGEVIGIVVTNGGEGYTNPVVTVSTGTGATFSVELGEASGNFPAVGTIFQQRQVYAATQNRPVGINGSKVGLYNNFDVSDVLTAGDAYEFDIDTNVIAPIKHLVPTRAGLLLCTSIGMWQLEGSNGAVTAVDVSAAQQSFTGVADVPPLRVNEDLLILDAQYSSVRLFAYSDFQKGYISNDISILSNQYFNKNNKIVSWEYFNSPHKLALAAREDGTLVAGCIVKEHEIYGWTDWSTRGRVKQIVNLREDARERSYMLVERYIGGTWRKYIESVTERQFTNVEDYIGLDSALKYIPTEPNATVTPSALTGEITLTAGSSIFTAGDVGKIFRGGGGKAEITAYTSGTEVTAEVIVPLTSVIPTTEIPLPLTAGEWTLDEPFDSLTGLEHLEGQTVTALLDGGVYIGLEVNGGMIELPGEFTRAVVGLPYECFGKALPLNSDKVSISTRRKRVNAVATYQHESRGLKFGTTRTNLYETREVTPDDLRVPPDLTDGYQFVSIEPVWEVPGTFYFAQQYPLPGSILGWVTSGDISEEED